MQVAGLEILNDAGTALTEGLTKDRLQVMILVTDI